MLGRACKILLGAPKPNVNPQPHQYFFLVKSHKTATLIEISTAKPFFFKTRSPNFAFLKLFLRRLSPQACL
jgi:hypothetical protein